MAGKTAHKVLAKSSWDTARRLLQMVTYDANDNTSTHILLCVMRCYTQLTRAYSGSGSSCRNFERVVLVSESTIHCKKNSLSLKKKGHFKVSPVSVHRQFDE